MASNQLTDLEAISDLVLLTYLDFSGNHVLDFQDIQALSNLQQLYAASNQLSTLESLQNLPLLQILSLKDNPVYNNSLYKTSILCHLNELKVRTLFDFWC